MGEIFTIFEKVNFLKSVLAICLTLFLIFNICLLAYYLYKKYRPARQPKMHQLTKYLRLGVFTTLGGIIIINGILLLGSVGLAASLVIPQPKVIQPKDPSLESIEITPQNPFKIIFDRPIDTAAIKKNISPELAGDWQYANTNYPYFTDTLVFVPKVSPAPESRYTISLSDIKNIAGLESSEYLLSFMTSPLPTIKSINPANGTEGVVSEQEIIVETDYPHQDTARLDFNLKPETDLTVTKESGTKYRLKAKEGLRKSTSYSLEIFRTPVSRNYQDDTVKDIAEASLISISNFRTIEAPGVSDYGPKGSGVMIDSAIWILFKQDMDKASTEKAFTLSPNVAGSFTWESNRKMVFKPAASLTKNTTYRASVSREAKVIDGSSLENDFSFSFITIGHVAVSSFYPGNNAYNIELSANVSVRFNQAVEHASAQNSFSISPQIAGSFSWSGNTMTFTHANFGYSTRYTINITSGIKTVYGLDSVKSYSSSFTTKQQSIMLNVPAYRQSHMYSCMASAARSALAYKGAYVGEDHLLSLMGYDRTAFSGTWGNPNSIWGNPYNAIVGDIDGKSGGVNWGYGAYWGPTARAISNYRGTETKTGWSVSGIASEISKGNPILVWWVNGVWPAYEVYWKTPSGTSIRGVNSMHVQTVKGFTGTVANPTSFTVVDSGYGYPQRTYDVGTFKAKWSWFGNTAVVVR